MRNWLRTKILEFLFPFEERRVGSPYFMRLVELQKRGVDIHKLPLRELARMIGCDGKPQIVKHHLSKLK